MATFKFESLYPDYDENDSWFCISDYGPIVDAIGKNVIWKTLGDYQGDFLIFFDDPIRGLGFLVLGYGSCSYCDALQSCQSKEEVEKFARLTASSVKWFTSLEESLSYFEGKDWEMEWYYNEEEVESFKEEVKGYINGK